MPRQKKLTTINLSSRGLYSGYTTENVYTLNVLARKYEKALLETYLMTLYALNIIYYMDHI